MRIRRNFIVGSAVLLLAQVLVVRVFHGDQRGILFSDLLLFGIGVVSILASLGAARQSLSVERNYWHCISASIGIWLLGEFLNISMVVMSNYAWETVDDFLFFASSMPFAMLLLLREEGFDRVHLLDVLQVTAFWASVYLFFAVTPNVYTTTVGWEVFGWTPDVLFKLVLILSFLFRALFTQGRARWFFVSMTVFLFASGLADSYVSFQVNQVQEGGAFDLLWGLLTIAPVAILFAASGRDTPMEQSHSRAQDVVVKQILPLLYPFFGILLLFRVAEREPLWASCVGALLFCAVGGRVLVIQNRLARAQDELEFEAKHDLLTGLWNRRAIVNFLETELNRQQRTRNWLSVLLIDIDHFKRVNDTHGHEVGDQVLKEIAHRFTECLRPYDFVGRYGGEEFLVMLADSDADQALVTAQRLRQGIGNSAMHTSAGSISITVSIGVFSSNGYSDAVHSSLILRSADEAMYRAKTLGRDRVESAILWGNARTATHDRDTMQPSRT